MCFLLVLYVIFIVTSHNNHLFVHLGLDFLTMINLYYNVFYERYVSPSDCGKEYNK